MGRGLIAGLIWGSVLGGLMLVMAALLLEERREIIAQRAPGVSDSATGQGAPAAQPDVPGTQSSDATTGPQGQSVADPDPPAQGADPHRGEGAETPGPAAGAASDATGTPDLRGMPTTASTAQLPGGDVPAMRGTELDAVAQPPSAADDIAALLTGPTVGVDAAPLSAPAFEKGPVPGLAANSGAAAVAPFDPGTSPVALDLQRGGSRANHALLPRLAPVATRTAPPRLNLAGPRGDAGLPTGDAFAAPAGLADLPGVSDPPGSVPQTSAPDRSTIAAVALPDLRIAPLPDLDRPPQSIKAIAPPRVTGPPMEPGAAPRYTRPADTLVRHVPLPSAALLFSAQVRAAAPAGALRRSAPAHAVTAALGASTAPKIAFVLDRDAQQPLPAPLPAWLMTATARSGLAAPFTVARGGETPQDSPSRATLFADKSAPLSFVTARAAGVSALLAYDRILTVDDATPARLDRIAARVLRDGAVAIIVGDDAQVWDRIAAWLAAHAGALVPVPAQALLP